MDTKTAKQVWQAALGELQIQVSKPNFDTWLRDTVLVSQEDNLFVIGAANPFAVEWLENRLQSLVKKTLTAIVGRTVDVRFVVGQAPRNGGGTARGAASTETGTRPGTARRALPGSRGGGDRDLATGRPAEGIPLPDAARAEASWSQAATAVPSGPGAAVAPPVPTPRFNSRYTFNSFIVGSCNRLAHAAAQAVAERPGEAYNPLFIYGGVGLGKTHLLHAMGHVALERARTVLYVSSEQFTNEFINAIRERRNEDFRNKYRRVDLLLIDDIQFLAGKEQTQEEFFHTFNDLHSANRQIVISSDRPPRSMPTLEDRLRSRFEWGLIADIQPPDLETRVAILRAKADLQDAPVPSDVLDYIAQKVQSNIRELEGSLNRVLAYVSLNRCRLTVDVAVRALTDAGIGPVRRRSITPDAIVDAVCKYYTVPRDQLCGRKRDKDIAFPRQMAMHLMREDTDLALAEIGRRLGGRDHTTVMHGCEKITREVGASPQIRRELMEIRELLQKK